MSHDIAAPTNRKDAVLNEISSMKYEVDCNVHSYTHTHTPKTVNCERFADYLIFIFTRAGVGRMDYRSE